MNRKGDFSNATKQKVLLWCKRHCCLCSIHCGTDIEIHHLVPNDPSIGNAMPLCFTCHSRVEKYNESHPLGTKYRIEELKLLRDVVYEKHTAHLVPTIHYHVTQSLPSGRTRTLPNVGFNINHKGTSLPVRVKVAIEPFLGKKSLGRFPTGHYSGKRSWSLNPGGGVAGHFWLPMQVLGTRKKIEVKVYVTIIDKLEREHELLPVGWVYMRHFNQWYYNP